MVMCVVMCKVVICVVNVVNLAIIGGVQHYSGTCGYGGCNGECADGNPCVCVCDVWWS